MLQHTNTQLIQIKCSSFGMYTDIAAIQHVQCITYWVPELKNWIKSHITYPAPIFRWNRMVLYIHSIKNDGGLLVVPPFQDLSTFTCWMAAILWFVHSKHTNFNWGELWTVYHKLNSLTMKEICIRFLEYIS